MGGERDDGPIEEIDGDAEVVRHAAEAYDSVALQQLLVPSQPHLAHEPSLVFVQVAVLAEEVLFDGCEGEEEGLVVAVVQTSLQPCQWCEIDRRFGFLWGC